MKKLRMKALELGVIEVLSRAQMKRIRGAGDLSNCIKNEYYGCDDGTCCPGCTCKRANNDWQCQGTCAYT